MGTIGAERKMGKCLSDEHHISERSAGYRPGLLLVGVVVGEGLLGGSGSFDGIGADPAAVSGDILLDLVFDLFKWLLHSIMFQL